MGPIFIVVRDAVAKPLETKTPFRPGVQFIEFHRLGRQPVAKGRGSAPEEIGAVLFRVWIEAGYAVDHRELVPADFAMEYPLSDFDAIALTAWTVAIPPVKSL